MEFHDPDRFAGAAFHDQFANGRRSGTLVVQTSQLIFRWDGGEVAMPLHGAAVQLGGAANRLLFFKHPNLPDWSIYTAEHSIMDHPQMAQYPDLASAGSKFRRRRFGLRVGYLVALASVATLVFAIIGARHWMVASLANQVPATWEQELGDQAMAQYKLQPQNQMISNDEITGYLARLTRPLLAAMPDQRHDYQFYIVDQTSINAMALPGGHVIIHRGLLSAATKDTQVMGVLAHEIAHVEKRHGLRNIINSLGIVVLAQAVFGDSTVFYGILMRAVPYLLRQEFSRDMEREADAYGLDLLRAANIDPQGMVDMFVIMRQEYGDTEIPDIVASHPSLEERIDHLQAKLADVDTQEFRSIEPVLASLVAAIDRETNHHSNTEQEE